MNERREILWLDASATVSAGELAALTGVDESELAELIECGALVPRDAVAADRVFDAHCIWTVRRALRLRRELELDTHAMALTLNLLERIGELERELHGLRARQPRDHR